MTFRTTAELELSRQVETALALAAAAIGLCTSHALTHSGNCAQWQCLLTLLMSPLLSSELEPALGQAIAADKGVGGSSR